MNDFLPDKDGIDHINVYSKARTILGRLLSNFAHTPITLNGLRFESIESWWYFTKMNKINESELFPPFTDEQLGEVRVIVGSEAKKYFRSLFKTDSYSFSPVKEDLIVAYKQKLLEHPEILQLLLANKLPIAHYYVMFDKKVDAIGSMWTAQLWEEISKEYDKDYES